MIVSDWTRRLRTELGIKPRWWARGKTPKNRKHRHLSVEPLDKRQLLSATVMYAALVVQDENAPPPVQVPDNDFGGGSQSAAMAAPAADLAASAAASTPLGTAPSSLTAGPATMATAATASQPEGADSAPASASGAAAGLSGSAGGTLGEASPAASGGSDASAGTSQIGAVSSPFAGQAAGVSLSSPGELAAGPAFGNVQETRDGSAVGRIANPSGDAATNASGNSAALADGLAIRPTATGAASAAGGAALQPATIGSPADDSRSDSAGSALGGPPQATQWGGENAGTTQLLSTGFVVEPTSAFVPGTLENYGPVTTTTDTMATPVTETWGIYTATVGCKSTLKITETAYGDGDWTYDESLKEKWSVTITGTDGSTSTETDRYSYRFIASGGPDGSTFTFTATGSSWAQGSLPQSGVTYAWTWNAKYHETIDNSTDTDTGTATGDASGSASTNWSYAASGTYPNDGGSASDSGGQHDSYSYAIGYSGVTPDGTDWDWSAPDASASASTSGSRQSTYPTAAGAYDDSGSQTSSDSQETTTWDVTGDETTGGSADSSYGYTMDYDLGSSDVPSGGWAASDGSGWSSAGGDAWTSYSGSGPYTGTGEISTAGTLNEWGYSDPSYNLQTTATWASGGWAQSGSEADSASGDSHDSYSGGGNFTDSGTNSGSGYDDTWSVPISEQEGGYDDSYCGGTTNYVLDSSGNWDATSVASASGGASASDGGPWQSGDGDAWTSYSGTGPYTDTDSADDATVSGTLNESGSDDVSYNLQSSTSGSGSPIGTETVVDSASAHDDYAGSGPYTDTGGQSGPGDDQTYDGTGWQQEGGYDDLSVGDTANYGLGGPGSYWANSGSGAESASGDGWTSYGLVGGAYTDTDAGSQGSMTGTFDESGSDDISYADQITAACSDGSWTQTGTDTNVESGNGEDDYSLGGPYTPSGTQSGSGDVETYSGTGAQSANGYDESCYGDTTSYALDASGNWDASGGSAWESDEGDAQASYSVANGAFTDTETGSAGPMIGSFDMSGADDSSYGDSASYTLDASGNWDPIAECGVGGGASGDDQAHYDYSASGPYSDAIQGGTINGTMYESGSEDTTDSYQTTLTPGSGSDGWVVTGTGATTDDGWDNFSYSGACSGYAFAANGGTMSGTASESGGASDSYSQDDGYTLDSGGNWDTTGASGWVSGGDNAHRSYAGSGTYGQEVGSATVGSGSFAQTIEGVTLNGNMWQSGYDDWTETYSDTNSLDNMGSSQSGSDSGTGDGANNFSYSANSSSGSYTDASDWSSVSAEEDGYHNTSYSESDGWTLASGSWNTTSASDSSTASAYDDWQYAASGEWSSATSNGDPNGAGDWLYSNAAGSYSDSVQESTTSNAFQESDASTDPWGNTTTSQAGGSQTVSDGAADSAFSAGDSYGSGDNSYVGDPYSYSYGQDSQQSATHDEYGYCQTDWSSGSGLPSPPAGNGASNEASGWTQSDASSSTSWYSSSADPSSGSTSTDNPSSASYDDPISSPGFDAAAYYSGPGLSAPASVTDPGSIFSDNWYESTPAATSDSMAAGCTAATAATASSPAGATSASAVSPAGHAGPTDFGITPGSPNGPTGGTSATSGPAYNAAGQVVSLTDADGGVTSFTYSPSGNLTSLTDPDGNTTTWTYNSQNQSVQQTDSLGSSYYLYNSAGELARYTDADGRVTTYQYNPQGELTQETWYADAADANAGQNVEDTFTYTYNSAGQMTSESDNTSSDTYAYDPEGWLVTATESAAGAPTVVLTYGYPAGSSSVTTQPSYLSASIDGTPDFLDTFQYNAQGQLTQIDRTGQSGDDAVANVEVDLTYNAAGQLATIDRYQGGQFVAESVYTYDSLGRLVSLVDSQGSTVLASYAYTYSSNDPSQPVSTAASLLSSIDPSAPLLPPDDPNQIALASLDQAPSASSLITSVESVDGTASYSYDPEGQLTGTAYSSNLQSQIPNPSSESFSYDSNGNRANPGYVTGPDNELLSDGTYTYQYDADGNQIERTDIATGAITLYTWDNRNRLVGLTDETASGQITQTVTYQYDASNRWIGETVTTYSDGSPSSVHTTDFAYNGNQIVLQFDATAAPGSASTLTVANLSHRYLSGQAVDEVFADEQVTSPQTPGNVVWTLTDDLGTVRDLAIYNAQTDVTTVSNHRVYDTFGNLTSQTNAAIDCLFGFAGLRSDEASGFDMSETRPYEPSTGRWSGQDSDVFRGGDTNLYRYCGNSPTNATDPSGKDWWPPENWGWWQWLCRPPPPAPVPAPAPAAPPAPTPAPAPTPPDNPHVDGIVPDRSHEAPEDALARILAEQWSAGNYGYVIAGPNGLVWEFFKGARIVVPPTQPPPPTSPGPVVSAPPPPKP